METLEDIEKEIRSCKRCELHKTKKNYVPGSGNPKAKIVFVGEAPGREEDLKGEPFVGAAGKFLNDVLSKVGIKREDVFICNVLKCRPPNNRDPSPEEVAVCGNYLIRQLEVIKPDMIVCLGRISANYLFDHFKLAFTKISSVQGKVFEVDSWNKKIKIVPVYHPAAVLYKPNLKDEYEKTFQKLFSQKRGQQTLLDYGFIKFENNQN
ncbi:MAG: type-4 uracil-DNA glycosylase [Archaeoglobaceae archaeon]|nr:type-4 uracil-DNA glycosylase [Archaeoglobaceae archaeon]MCX8152067.1 type-4 uracil-DNA glycosylase [Archaeoglobaceae archaeon]MDW8013832.1 type-4 uracil-DNA glycosylase [Archaeoglobaceae archaeon]